MNYQLEYVPVYRKVLFENHDTPIQVIPVIYKNEVFEELFMDNTGNIYTSRSRDITRWMKKDTWIRRCTYNVTSTGYPCVMYKNRKDNINQRLRVHIAVASTFMPIHKLDKITGVPDAVVKLAKEDNETLMFLYNTLQVNHIDHNPGNFALKNLEWITARGNIDAYRKYAGYI